MFSSRPKRGNAFRVRFPFIDVENKGSVKGVVAAKYKGGTIVKGHVLGKRVSESEMELLYLSATIGGEVKAGKAHAKFSRGDDKKLHMHMDWQWLTGDHSSGQSEWVLVP